MTVQGLKKGEEEQGGADSERRREKAYSPKRTVPATHAC